MALPTWDEFSRQFPKLLQAGPALYGKALEDAKLWVDEVAFGIRYERAVAYKAASLLESGKYGQVVPLPSKTETNEYEKRFQEMCDMVPRKMMIL